MKPFPHLALAAGVFALISLGRATPVRAEPFRYSLLLQRESSAERGFKLFLEDASTPTPRPKEKLQLVLSVADGKAWRSVNFQPSWQWDRTYRVKAVLGLRNSDLYLDGRRVARSSGGFAPNTSQPVKAGLESRNIAASTGYFVRQTALKLTTNRKQRREFAFPEVKTASPLYSFEPQTPLAASFALSEGEILTIETSFRLVHKPDLKPFGPLVDRYGQSVQAQWTGKIRSEADFKQASASEQIRQAAWGIPAQIDAYGGTTNAGWNEKPSGFFRTTRRNGFYWLMTPLGNPCFYLGVDTVTGTSEKTAITGREGLFEALPAAQGEFAGAWGDNPDSKSFGFTSANLIRKFGENWQDEAWRDAEKRLKTWGFSGIGKWSGVTTAKSPLQLPCQPVLRRTGVPTLGRLPDTFDPEVRAIYRAVLEKGIGAQKNNPFVIGWSVQNEHDEIVLKSDVVSILQKPATVPAKRAFVGFALDKIYGGDATKLAAAWKIEAPNATRETIEAATPQAPAADIETLRRFYADDYYGFIYRTVKEIDPNHLYFGFWISPGWWENEEDWRLSAKHCDVVGFDRYDAHFSDERLNRLMKESDKAVMCGEFSFPAFYGGARGYGVFGTSLFGTWTGDDAASGASYAVWVDEAARNPYCVGMHWFQYRDQPITGRSPSGTKLVNGEHFAFGLVDITDRPKWEMIAPMRQANLSAVKTRLAVSPAPR